MRRLYSYLFVVILVFLGACAGPAGSNGTPTLKSQPRTTPTSSIASGSLPLSQIAGIHLPSGFQMSVYARGLSAPRFTTMGPKGTLLVANRGSNSVVALVPGSSPLQATRSMTLVSGLHDPTSLNMYNGYLYIGEEASIARVKLDANLQVGPIERIITLPAGGEHVTRTVLIGPDKHIYVAIGSTCNVCVETDPQRAAVWVYNLDGSNGRLFSKGLRNAVGLAINPWNNDIWATDNGRDNLGDNVPPDTVYMLQDGGNYGWPYCHAGTIIDPNMGHPGDCNGVVQPLIDLQAHSAPLGLAFYNANQFPSSFHGVFIAFHGSWNRSVRTGYKVVFVPLNSQGQVSGQVEDFATGWLHSNGEVTGRPVGITVAPDGSLFISDDSQGVIYHIWYRS